MEAARPASCRMLCGLVAARRAARFSGTASPSARIERQYLSSVTYVGHRCAVKDELTTLENLRVSSALSGCELSREEARRALGRMSLGEQETPSGASSIRGAAPQTRAGSARGLPVARCGFWTRS